jgi:hypothetical protein
MIALTPKEEQEDCFDDLETKKMLGIHSFKGLNEEEAKIVVKRRLMY